MSAGFAEEIIAVSRTMLTRGLVTGTTGNVSVRDDRGSGMLITPTRVHPDDLTPEGLIAMRLDGGAIPPGAIPSLEWRLHALVYAHRPDVTAIVHTHSPHAVARSFDPAPLVVRSQERTYFGLEEIHVADPVRAGSAELAEAGVSALGGRPVALLGHHGVLAAGDRPRDVLELATLVEHLAQIDLLLRAERIAETL